MRKKIFLSAVAGRLPGFLPARWRGGAPMRSRRSRPLAKKVAKELTMHGHTRVDEYYWLNQRENPEVIAYLQAENAYTDAVMKPAPACARPCTGRWSAACSRPTCRCPISRTATGTTPASKRGRTTRSTAARRRRCRAPSRSCWTATAWRPAQNISTSARSPSARTTPPWPTAWTPCRAASTASASAA